MIKKKKKSKLGTDIEKTRRVFAGLDSDGKFWKPKQGNNIIRILPANDGEGVFAFHQVLHHGFKVEGKARAYPCMGTFKKPCPVCMVIAFHDTDTDPDVQEIIKNIGPRHAYLMNIIDRSDHGGIVKIYSAPKSVFADIMNYMNDDEYGDITSAEEGRDVKIHRTGEKLATRYNTRVSPKESAVGVENWISQMHNLEREAYKDIPSSKKYGELLEDNFGNVLNIDGALGREDAEESEEEEERPKAKKKGVNFKARVKGKVSDDEEEESDSNDLETMFDD